MSSFNCLSSNHWIGVIKTLGDRNAKTDHFADVSIHCKNGTILHAHRSVLASCSGFLAKLFSLENPVEYLKFVTMTYNLICPDVESEVMQKIMQVIYTGSVNVSQAEVEEMKSTLESLQMDRIRRQLDHLDLLNHGEVPEDEKVVNFFFKEKDEMMISNDVTDENDPIAIPIPIADPNKDPIAVPIVDLMKDPSKIPIVVPIGNLSKNPITAPLMDSSNEPVADPIKAQLADPKPNLYTCDQCSATFPLKIALKKHSVQVHKQGNGPTRSPSSKNKPRVKKTTNYGCHLCPASFHLRNDLLRHVSWVHFREELRKFCGKTKLECGVCSAVFTRETNVIRHLAWTHNLLDGLTSKGNWSPADNQSGNGDTTNPKEFVCITCNAHFVLESELRLHVVEVHHRPEVQASEGLECGLCFQSFAKEDDLLSHLRVAHQGSGKTVLYGEEQMIF
jgi:hypothetical protein